MPTSYTSLLGLALPATGELSGSWGTTVNNSITELVEDAIAASATASVTSADWTLSTTGAGAVNEARCAILIPTGTPGVARNINAPNTSKAYIVVNQSNAAVTIRGVTGPTTGVSIAASARALVAWNGSDFVVVSDFPINISSGSADITGTLALGNGGSGQTTAQNAMNTFAGAVTSGSYLRGNGTNVVMSAIQAGDVPTLNQNTTGTAGNVTGTVAVANGGSGQTTAQNAMNTFAGAVTSGQYLRGNGTNVLMSAIQAGDVPTLNQNTTGTAANVTGTVAVANGGTGQTTYTDGQLLIGNTVGNTLTKATLTQGSGVTITNGNGTITIAATGSGGTITSVGATAPVASSGGTAPTISLNANYGDTLNPYASKTANFFLAAPNGTAGVPTFRAIAAADIPTLNQNTTGTAANVTGIVAVANGGTGVTTAQAEMNRVAGAVTSGSYLRGNGTNVVMSAIQAGDVPTLNQNTTGTAGNVTGTVAVANGGSGQTTAQNAMNTFAGGVTNAQYLRGNGTNVVLSAIQAGDVPTLNQNTTGTAGNVTGTVAIANGGTGATTNTAARTNLGASTVGSNLFTLTNPSAVTFIKVNADNTVATETAGTFRTSIGAAASGANTDITALDQDITITATGTIAADTIGYRGIPVNSQTAGYTLTLADASKFIRITTGGVAIPANGTTAFPIGSVITVYNDSASSQNITITTDTLRLAGTATTGTRAVAQRGIATLLKVNTTEWVASGVGVT